MKICSPQLGLSPTSSLGGEIYDYETLKGFSKKGIKVYIYLPKGRNYDKNLKNFYVTYSFLRHVVPPWLYSFICLPYLFKTYKKEKFDILRIHSPRFLGIAAIIFHFFYPDVPILTSAVTPKESRLLYIVEKKIYQISSKIIVQSQYMKSRLHITFNLPLKKIAVTYGGVVNNIKVYPKKSKADISRPSSDKILLFMGVLNKRKNPLFLVEVLKKVSTERPQIKLVLIGTGEQKNDVKKALDKNNLSQKALFIDSAYEQKKAFWLNKMDIFVLPSLDEGLGLSLLEAMSAGKPAVVSNIPPFKEIIENAKDGFTLPLNVNIWAKTIVELLKDARLKSQIGQKAKLKVRELFTWERMYQLNAQVVTKMVK